MSTIPFLLDLAAAIGIGALVGLEREHRRDQTHVIAGVRTFPLISAAGFLTAFIGATLASPWPLALGTGAILLTALGFFIIRYLAGDLGFTTPMAIVVTYLAGALIGLDFLLEAIVVSVATTFLLLTKTRLHRLAEALTRDEIMGALQFVALAFVAFPLAAQAEGPYLRGLVGQGRPIDLQWTVLIVVAASGLSFLSFLTLRKLGGREGLPAAGALGGLVNSEAATASVATLSKQSEGYVMAATAAVLAATGTSIGRNLVLAAIADPTLTLVGPLALLLAIPFLLVVGGMAWVGRGAKSEPPAGDIGLENPFAIKPALTFALVFTAVNAASFYLQAWAGDLGVYATSLGALVSTGAVIASVANLVFTGTISLDVGLITGAIATVIGFVTKLGIVSGINRRMLRPLLGPIVAASVATGLGVLVLV